MGFPHVGDGRGPRLWTTRELAERREAKWRFGGGRFA